MRRLFLALLLSTVIPMSCVLADYIDLTEQGNQAVTKNDLDDALKLYKEAQVEKPGDPLLDYNIGTVLNKQSKYDEALERYRKALYSSDPDFQADAYYNLGNTFFRAQKYADAISAYQKDLELRPDDIDAKYNLELARKKLKDQSQQQQSQDQKQDQQKQDQQQQNQQQDQQQQKQDQQGDQQQQQQQQQQQDKQQDQQKQDQEQQGDQQKDQQGAAADSTKDNQQQQGAQSQDQQEGMSKEDAQRILNAISGDEKQLQKQVRRLKVKSSYSGKDW
jgi:Ca-activated chloride channel family protein